jgi:hypothetical protein
MTQRFSGLVEIQNAAADPMIRILLSGESGSGQFIGERDDSPTTTVTNRRIAIGHKPRPIAKVPAAPGKKPGGPFSPDEGVAAPVGGETVDTSKDPTTVLTVGDEALPGGLFIADAKGQHVVKLNGVAASLTVGAEGNAGDVIVIDAQGNERIRLNGSTGDIELAGGDCAEEFDLEDDVADIEPGTVVTIGEDGGLRPSNSAYDRRVAGIVSGAGPYRPGIVLDKTTEVRRRVPLALVGKAYCKVDARYAAIEVGDSLTTSPTAGCAMKAMEAQRTPGTVIGKALQSLEAGQGFIPVLVVLQ